MIVYSVLALFVCLFDSINLIHQKKKKNMKIAGNTVPKVPTSQFRCFVRIFVIQFSKFCTKVQGRMPQSRQRAQTF